MSKVSDAKKSQNYQCKPLARRCRICKHFLSEEVKNNYVGIEEKNMMGGMVGFKITPHVFDLFEYKAVYYVRS